jgi:hypothetical protein
MYEDFLKTVELLKSLDHYEISKLATVIKEQKFSPNDLIIREVIYIFTFIFNSKSKELVKIAYYWVINT